MPVRGVPGLIVVLALLEGPEVVDGANWKVAGCGAVGDGEFGDRRFVGGGEVGVDFCSAVCGEGIPLAGVRIGRLGWGEEVLRGSGVLRREGEGSKR